MVSAIIPVTHQIPRAMLMSVNEEALRHHFLGILELVPGAEELLINNPLKRAHWSLNRDIFHVTFVSPINDSLHAMTHHAICKFFNVTDDTVPSFIERPTISSIKWASVPCYDADNKEITKILLNKSIFLNGKVCRTLPWINQNSMPQCTQCLRWGHSRASCQTNLSYCAICSGRHMTSDHQNSRLRGETSKYNLACINCLAAGLDHAHKATDRLCPFYMERNNKRNITALLTMIRERRLEGFENPFGLTKVRRASQTSGSG